MNFTYKKTFHIPKNEIEYIHNLLTKEPESEDKCLGEESTISYTANFGNGYEMDVKVCGVKYQEGESNLPYTEAVLLYNGSQEAYTDPDDMFEGVWELTSEDDDTYIVEIKCTEEDDSLVNVRYFDDAGRCVLRKYKTIEEFVKNVETDDDDAPKTRYVNVKISFDGEDAETGMEFDTIEAVYKHCKALLSGEMIFKVGQIVWCKNLSAERKQKPMENCISKYTIVKVGRKYLTIRPYGFQISYCDLQVDKETLIQKTDYSPDYQMYLFKQDIENEMQYKKMAAQLYQTVRDWPFIEPRGHFNSYHEAVKNIKQRKVFLEDILAKL